MSKNYLSQNKRIRPGVKALIVYKNKILMIHERITRNGKVHDIIDFPGGGINFGENLEDALIREVKEEVCLDIEVKKIVGAWDFMIGFKEHGNKEKKGTHIICIGYQCSVVGKPVIDITKNPAPEDVFDWKWYSKKELLANNGAMLRVAGMAEAVKNLIV